MRVRTVVARDERSLGLMEPSHRQPPLQRTSGSPNSKSLQTPRSGGPVGGRARNRLEAASGTRLEPAFSGAGSGGRSRLGSSCVTRASGAPRRSTWLRSPIASVVGASAASTPQGSAWSAGRTPEGSETQRRRSRTANLRAGVEIAVSHLSAQPLPRPEVPTRVNSRLSAVNSLLDAPACPAFAWRT